MTIRRRLRYVAAAVALVAILPGCYHHVSLSPPTSVTMTGGPLLPARVEIPPETAEAEYNVKSFMAGGANNWTVDVGKAISAYADAYLPSAFPPGGTATVRVDLEHFEVHDFEAHADLRFAVLTPAGTIFRQTYSGAGKGYAARVVWGGAFAMKSSMRRTTDEALRACFEHFLEDAQRLAPEWKTAVAAGTKTP